MILANRDWDAPLPADTADLDMTEQVATTFARYPYPESFFTWRGGTHGVIFFSRSTRLHRLDAVHRTERIDSPISVVVDPPHRRSKCSSAYCRRIAAQQRYAVFDTDFAGVPYQVVARVTYADPLREHLESVSGFTVNLDWVRTQYFADILRDVGPSASGGLTQDVALLDDDNQHDTSAPNNDAAPLAERAFPLLFIDSSDTAVGPSAGYGPAGVEASRQRITRSDVAVGTSTCRHDTVGHRRRRHRLRHQPGAGAPNGAERREAFRNALALRVVGHSRSQDAAREHPCAGGHAGTRVPGDFRTLSRVPAPADPGSDQPRPTGRQPARVCADHGRDGNLCLRTHGCRRARR